jgi:hypothetical protein
MEPRQKRKQNISPPLNQPFDLCAMTASSYSTHQPNFLHAGLIYSGSMNSFRTRWSG